jgi:hypothetical protein
VEIGAGRPAPPERSAMRRSPGRRPLPSAISNSGWRRWGPR